MRKVVRSEHEEAGGDNPGRFLYFSVCGFKLEQGRAEMSDPGVWAKGQVSQPGQS